MSYKSPISVLCENTVKDIVEKENAYLVECVHKVGFDVDEEELRMALQYDRHQYMFGFRDGRQSQIERIDKLKALASMLLEKYKEAAFCCIGEYSVDIDKDLDELNNECRKLRAEINEEVYHEDNF